MKMLALSDLHSKKSSLLEIISVTSGVDLVAICGDLTNLGLEGEARELLELIPFDKICIPGNMDSVQALKEMEECGVSLHSKKLEMKGEKFAGYGGGLTGSAGKITSTEQEIEKALDELVEKNSILLTHLPPKNSELDGKKHIGSSAVGKIIKGKKPKIHLCGHAHDSRGIQTIGDCLSVNCGPAKFGSAAIIDVKKKEAELL